MRAGASSLTSISETPDLSKSPTAIAMYTTTIFRASVAIATALLVSNAFAWGKEGHQVVASLAETQLSAKAHAEVDRLLALEPGATLQSISTWADEHRNPATGPWHYVNFPRNTCTYDAARECPDGNCVVGAITKQLEILSSSAPDDVRLKALKYVVHFEADVHQPLHTGYADDKGGNGYQLQAFMRGSNLHSFWDSGLIKNLNEDVDALLVTPLAMLGVLVEPLWDLAALAISALSWYLQALAALPFATLTVAQAPLWAGAVGVLGGLLLAMQLPWSLRLMGLPLMLPVLLWQVPAPQPGQFELLAADIGQGNAVLVRTASHALLYDAGPRFSRESDAGNRVLVPLLRSLQLRLDLLVLSHRDIDHTGGAPAVLKMQPQAELLSSIEDDHELQALRPTRRCATGQRWQWDGVDFEVLSPLAQDYELELKSNAMSCVLRISNGVQTALLVGDIEQAQEQHLVEQAQLAGASRLQSDLLLVPHHGSRFSSSAAFLDAVQPRFALVQAGYRNRFGHPAPSVLVHYQERGIRVIDSPHCGAMRWKSDQAQAIHCQRMQSQHYWQHQLP